MIKILVGVCINKGVLELTHIDSRAHASRSHLALGWSQAFWIMFGSSRLKEEVLQEDFMDFEYRYIWFSWIDRIKTSLHGLMYIRFDLYTSMLHILEKLILIHYSCVWSFVF